MLTEMLTPLWKMFETMPYLLDGLRVAVIGVVLEMTRRYATRAVSALSTGLTVSYEAGSDDEVYWWIESWIADQIKPPSVISTDDGNITSIKPTEQLVSTKREPSLWAICLDSIWPAGRVPPRHLAITNVPLSTVMHSWSSKRLDPDAGANKDELGRPTLHLHPGVNTQMVLRFQGKVIKLNTWEQGWTGGKRIKWIKLSSFLGSNQLLEDFIAHAYKAHQSRDKGKLRIYAPAADARKGGEHWSRQVVKNLRPWESVILPEGVKENLLADCEEFLNDPAFYEDRGIPYRRGYLLHGVPGAGKSSLMAALASELGLDIYMLQLGDPSLDDTILSNLLAACPRRSMLLLEDVDCAMPTRQPEKGGKGEGEDAELVDAAEADDTKADDTAADDDKDEKKPNGAKGGPAKSRITLSGLLNALDGVASSEGRLTFFTTNHPEKIDPAMSRPGRCDVWLEFTNASQNQARGLFLRFNGKLGKADEKVAVNAGLDEKADLKLSDLADEFARAIPEDKVSVSALQAYLLRYKRDPAGAVAGVKEWVEGGCKQESLTKK